MKKRPVSKSLSTRCSCYRTSIISIILPATINHRDNMNRKLLISIGLLFFMACNKKVDYDASGTFEADEVIVSAEQTGKILSLPIREGQTMTAGVKVGDIDVSNLELQKQQKQASVAALSQKMADAGPQ